MEEISSRSNNEEVVVENFGHRVWWWGLASATQLGWGIATVRRGYAGDTNFMPLKAFGVASLFVGAAATAFVGTLRASGIHKVEDMKALGSSIRTTLGAPPRKRAE
ncbi:hypothetical protein RND81_06G187700 [Saponaria officinalis]|uniref:Uncharacterized protein n=1 Tax=Saponaria officinalis TaxID=3572 RepID=A0AAW1KCL3_SAPOF